MALVGSARCRLSPSAIACSACRSCGSVPCCAPRLGLISRNCANGAPALSASSARRLPVLRARVLLLRLPLLHSAVSGRLWHSRADPLRFRQMLRSTASRQFSVWPRQVARLRVLPRIGSRSTTVAPFPISKAPHVCSGVPRFWHALFLLPILLPSGQPRRPVPRELNGHPRGLASGSAARR